ncbi:MAG: CPBP family intramembrane metalloprotease [Ruminococcaceae bacterium]|nr:CPBP family intramembrane metalloprotease [Oscillospiraceae bacterium]
MMKRLYDKNPILFAVAWIVAYCALMSVGDVASAAVGMEKSITLPVALLLSAVLLVFLKKNDLLEIHGLCAPKRGAGRMLWYFPVLLMLTANLWYGVAWTRGVAETALYLFTMLCVGFLEEIIFRGLLFNAMRRDSLVAAVIISSVTFGIGHILNLVNGSGAELIPNLLQVVYATAAGLMFVMLYCRSGSLIVCIASHGLFNALSAFSKEAPTLNAQILSCVALTAITGGYAVYLMLSGGKPTDASSQRHQL